MPNQSASNHEKAEPDSVSAPDPRNSGVHILVPTFWFFKAA